MLTKGWILVAHANDLANLFCIETLCDLFDNYWNLCLDKVKADISDILLDVLTEALELFDDFFNVLCVFEVWLDHCDCCLAHYAICWWLWNTWCLGWCNCESKEEEHSLKNNTKAVSAMTQKWIIIYVWKVLNMKYSNGRELFKKSFDSHFRGYLTTILNPN